MIRRIAALSIVVLMVANVAVFVATVVPNEPGSSGLRALPRSLDGSAEDKRFQIMGDRLTAIRLIQAHTEPEAVVAVPVHSEGFAVLEIGRLYLYPRRLIQAHPVDVDRSDAGYVLLMDAAMEYAGERIAGAGDTMSLYRVTSR